MVLLRACKHNPKIAKSLRSLRSAFCTEGALPFALVPFATNSTNKTNKAGGTCH